MLEKSFFLQKTNTIFQKTGGRNLRPKITPMSFEKTKRLARPVNTEKSYPSSAAFSRSSSTEAWLCQLVNLYSLWCSWDWAVESSFESISSLVEFILALSNLAGCLENCSSLDDEMRIGFKLAVLMEFFKLFQQIGLSRFVFGLNSTPEKWQCLFIREWLNS